ncbi:MAG: MBL fold metallo-hydrolase [Deltaproteobacteria bacterium]|nr:MBL fold metallo-hydrolase [Deltaproteobacteria bacterium]
MIENVKWLGHSTFRIDGSRTVYFDPWQLGKNPRPADLILITHPHYDHCSPDDVKKIIGKDTIVVASPDCADRLPVPVVPLSPGGRTEAGGVLVEAIPAYNTNKKFHPRSAGWNGYIVTLDGVRIYHAGDTDVIPEMKGLSVDIMLAPVGGTYTMNADEAAGAAAAVGAKTVIPMHYGAIVGSAADAEALRRRCACEVVILSPGE